MIYSTKTIRRFWSKVAVAGKDDCWEWLAYCDDKFGYGRISINDIMVQAHRVSLELELGRLLVGKECSLHTCDNPSCQNPKHLFLGTRLDNMRDKVAKGRHKYGKGNAKLTKLKARTISELYDSGAWTQYELAELFQISQATISNIVNDQTWK